jgi:hypothetical protein
MTLTLTLTKCDRKKRIPLYRKISHTRALSVFFKSGYRAIAHLNNFYLACRSSENLILSASLKKVLGKVACQIKIEAPGFKSIP